MPGPNIPIAIIAPAEQEVVVGSVAKLDGRSSLDPNEEGLAYVWFFKQVPIGSQVELFGFTNLETDSSIVSFAPDITGTYKIRLIVSDNTNSSDPTESLVDVRVILVPHHQGFVPDASFIWNYLSDFWNLVPDKRRFEVVWSSMIQVVSSEMLKLYQYQYSRSIRDIQETIQKRWLHFTPSLELDRDLTRFILSEETAGSQASTFIIDPTTGVSEPNQPTYSNIITIPRTEGDFTRTKFGVSTAIGRLIRLGQRTFTLARVNSTLKAFTSNTDGATYADNRAVVPNCITFTGSQFLPSMVGATLRILGPESSPIVGDYPIGAFVSSTEIEALASSSAIWAASTGLIYSVLPALAHTSFFADREQVPAALDNQNWRMSSTLISDQYDFDKQGVSIGDLMEIEVQRQDLQVLSTFFVQVTGVDRNRLSFSFNLEDLVDGTSAVGLTKDIQVTLASDLIVSGLSADINGNLSYVFDAAVINSTINSVKFKRTYFEKILTTNDSIDVGVFSITARPVRIIRNNKIAIDTTIVSIPILQEYIRQPDIVKEGNRTFFASNDTRTEVARSPYLLSENLDYVIDDETTIFGACRTEQGNDQVSVPFGDLIDRSVTEGDILEITQGTTVESFDIRRVISADVLQVSPVPTITSTSAVFKIIRKVAGKFIRFVDGVFSKIAPAPTRLWSEISYLDNNETIEGNFGILVGVRREDLSRISSGISYKSAVAGLMYALSRGPTISNLALSGHILLGLPFAQNAGVIKEINQEFRKRDDGSPLFGRILVEGRDRKGNPTGVTNLYFYPQGRQIFDEVTSRWIPALPELSGLAINPDTGLAYAVGDEVSQFAPLSKGVNIREYLATPDLFNPLIAQGNIASQLQKYHAFQIVVNSDVITSTDTDLVAQFLTKAKAHYVRLISALLRAFVDNVEIEDTIAFGRAISFFESSDLGAPTAPKLDNDDSSYAVLSLDGVFYSRYCIGNDLATTKGSSIVQSATGGFITARNLLESWDPPLTRAGDILKILTGSNVGKYPISTVDSDIELTLDLGPDEFETATSQSFIIFRPLQNPIWSGEVSITTGSNTIETMSGIGSAGVSVGDKLVFTNFLVLNPTVSKPYTVIEVIPNISTPQIIVAPIPTEPSEIYDAWVIREGIMTSGEIDPPGSTGETFYASGTISDHYLNFVDAGSHINSWLNLSLLYPGSRIVVDNIPYEVIRFEPATRRAALSSPLIATYSDKQVTIDLRPFRPSTPASVDFLDRIPADSLELGIISSLTSDEAIHTISGSSEVVLTVGTFENLGVVSGDYLQLFGGIDAVRDVGHGPGVFPIRETLVSIGISNGARLLDEMTNTGTFRYGIIRKMPNEG